LKNGENFALLAIDYSTDTSNASAGGDLNWFGKGKMVPEFEAAVFALKNPGDFTMEPVKTQFGYHIIQLLERGYSPEEIQAAKNKAFSDWLEKAKTDYGVETFDLWKTNVPTQPDMNTMATEAADAQRTAIAKEKEATKEATPTPK
jgi:parvulin-like peptidyl-prolyl isomerase